MKSGAEDDLFSDDTDESPEGKAVDDAGEQDDASAMTDAVVSSDTRSQRPYIIRREMQNGDIKFERPNRVAMFVHDDVADGEQALVSELQTQLAPDPKKLDVREAVYRAALANKADVLAELVEMGYDVDE